MLQISNSDHFYMNEEASNKVDLPPTKIEEKVIVAKNFGKELASSQYDMKLTHTYETFPVTTWITVINLAKSDTN